MKQWQFDQKKRPDIRHLEEIRVQLYCVSHWVDTIHFHITYSTFNEGIAATAAEMPCEMPALPTGRPFLSPSRFCTWLQGTPACSKTAGHHRDQGRRMGLEGSPRSAQLWTNSLPSQGRGHGCSPLPPPSWWPQSLRLWAQEGSAKLIYSDPQPGKAPKPLLFSSLQEALHRGVATGHQSTTNKVHSVFSSYTTIPLPPLFLHLGMIHYLSSPRALGEGSHCRIFLVVVRYYFVCMFSKASGQRVRQARASAQPHCCELPSAQVAHCLGTLMKFLGFRLIAQNAPEIARSGEKVQCRRWQTAKS